MHKFPEDIDHIVTEGFTDPFRYSPHPLVSKAATLVMQHIEGLPELHEAFMEGKMLGVLLVSDAEGAIGYLAGFSGNVGGRSTIEGFAPPIYDLLDPAGHFKLREAEIISINKEIEKLSGSARLGSLKEELSSCMKDRDMELEAAKEGRNASRMKREKLRKETSDPSRLNEMIRESQFEKAELKRLKIRWEEKISGIKGEISCLEAEINGLKVKRASMSDELQRWIFSRYIVHNHAGEAKTIGEIFEANGLIPPGGTGECAAPKLLEHAYRKGLKPLAMGEFWYGQSPSTAVRTHGHFYPSCTSKCGPLLGFMMKGLAIRKTDAASSGLETIYEDASVIAVEKPSGMPSVPGLDGKVSAYEHLCQCHEEIHVVHRLDMDTSGLLLFAKTAEAAVCLQKQFEAHTIDKTYHARLSPSAEGKILKAGDKGEISLPLSPDYDERPRQKVDIAQGKPAFTTYEIVSISEDGTIDIHFHPHTGRTHQLRVHAAHTLGLGHPIVGDMLYGGSPASRLALHAFSISFEHPATDVRMTLSTSR